MPANGLNFIVFTSIGSTNIVKDKDSIFIQFEDSHKEFVIHFNSKIPLEHFMVKIILVFSESKASFYFPVLITYGLDLKKLYNLIW